MRGARRFRTKAFELGYGSVATTTRAMWSGCNREEHLLGAFLVSHYRPNTVRVVHPKNDEEARWPLFDETQRYPEKHSLSPVLMAELDARMFSRGYRRLGFSPRPRPSANAGAIALPRGDLDYFLGV